MSALVCERCGTSLPLNAAFCGGCGAQRSIALGMPAPGETVRNISSPPPLPPPPLPPPPPSPPPPPPPSPPPPPPPSPPPPPPPSPPAPQIQNNVANQIAVESSRSPKAVIIGSIAVVAILSVVGIVLVGSKSTNNSDSNAGTPSSGSSASANRSTAPLKIGSLLPATGNLSFLGPPMVAGLELAIDEINAAGGVLGQPVQHLPGDSGDTSDSATANQTVTNHINSGVSAIVGAASSGVTLSVIDKIVAAGIVQISPSNTDPSLSTYADGYLYFRTAPPDTFQGKALGLLLNRQGASDAVVLYINDSYGQVLSRNLQENFAGNANLYGYDYEETDFSGLVRNAKSKRPDSIVLIGFDETPRILTELIKQGIGPNKVQTYLVDGNLSSMMYKDLPRNIMKGVKATLPGVLVDKDLQTSLLGVNPDLSDFSYAPETYDAVVLIALAAEKGKGTDSKTISENLDLVSSTGKKCRSFTECKQLLDAGLDIDYDGFSGAIEFDDNGDPSIATMTIFEYLSNSRFVPREDLSITSSVPFAKY